MAPFQPNSLLDQAQTVIAGGCRPAFFIWFDTWEVDIGDGVLTIRQFHGRDHVYGQGQGQSLVSQ